MQTDGLVFDGPATGATLVSGHPGRAWGTFDAASLTATSLDDAIPPNDAVEAWTISFVTEDVAAPMPLPASVSFTLAGLVGLGWLVRRRSSQGSWVSGVTSILCPLVSG